MLAFIGVGILTNRNNNLIGGKEGISSIIETVDECKFEEEERERINGWWSEWPSSKSLQTINAGGGVEKRMQTGITTMENSVEIP